MSPFNKINATLTQQQIDGIQAGIDMIKENLTPQHNLTDKEKTDLPNIANARYPFAKRAIEQHGPANAQIVAGTHFGPLPEAQTDMTFFDQMQPFIGQLRQLVEIFVDTQHVAGSELWAWFRDFYDSAVRASKSNVPGSDAVVEDLKPIFDRPNQGGDEPMPGEEGNEPGPGA